MAPATTRFLVKSSQYPLYRRSDITIGPGLPFAAPAMKVKGQEVTRRREGRLAPGVGWEISRQVRGPGGQGGRASRNVVKVFALVKSLAGFGPERALLGLCAGARPHGHSMAVATLLDDVGFDLPPDGDFIIGLCGQRPLSGRIRSVPAYVKAARRLSKLLRETRPDCLYVHDVRSAAVASLASIPAETVRLYQVHEHPDSPLAGVSVSPLRGLSSRFARRADAVLVSSRSDGDRCVHDYSCDPRKIHLLPGGVRSHDPRERPSKEAARRRLGLPQDAEVLLNVGPISPAAGQRVLNRAVRRLYDEGRNVMAVLVGDGEHRSEVDRQISELGLKNRFSMPGPQRDVRDWLAACDVYVQPSSRSHFGFAAAEAAEAGRPVVGTNVDGVADIVRNEATGLLVPHDDVRSLVEAIRGLLDDPARRERMGCAARELATRRCTPADFWRAVEAIVAEAPRRRPALARN